MPEKKEKILEKPVTQPIEETEFIEKPVEIVQLQPVEPQGTPQHVGQYTNYREALIQRRLAYEARMKEAHTTPIRNYFSQVINKCHLA